MDTTHSVIRLHGTPPQITGFALQQKDGAYLTAHGRMGTLNKAAVFVDEIQAREVWALWDGHLRERWGEGLHIQVENWSGFGPPYSADVLAAKALALRFASNLSLTERQLEDGRIWIAQKLRSRRDTGR
jgi:hypothetical protein